MNPNHPVRLSLIAAGLLTPPPTPLAADELDEAGFRVAASAQRRRLRAAR